MAVFTTRCDSGRRRRWPVGVVAALVLGGQLLVGAPAGANPVDAGGGEGCTVAQPSYQVTPDGPLVAGTAAENTYTVTVVERTVDGNIACMSGVAYEVWLQPAGVTDQADWTLVGGCGIVAGDRCSLPVTVTRGGLYTIHVLTQAGLEIGEPTDRTWLFPESDGMYFGVWLDELLSWLRNVLAELLDLLSLLG